MSTAISNTPSPSPNSGDDGRLLRVRHQTRYRYQGSASQGYNLAWLTPRAMPDQQRIAHRVNVDPLPRTLESRGDGYGNTLHYFEVHKAHTRLQVSSEATVRRWPAPDLRLLKEPWESTRCGDWSLDARALPPLELSYPSPMVALHPEVTAYVAESFTPKRALGAALLDFNTRLHADFHYQPGVTSVETPVAEVWEKRSGVCQDFAHLAIAGLRGLGLATAYVSGYVLTRSSEDEALQGGDASHAWYAVFTPTMGWVQLDPTNNLVVGDEHIVIAIARDYSDVPPVKGVCYGGGQHQLEVSVSVEVVSEDQHEH